MAELDDYRADTRAWLGENCPPSVRAGGGGSLYGITGGKKWNPANPDERVWLERGAEKGLTAPMWPTEYGGGGLSKEQNKALLECMRELKTPPPLVGFGLTMIGPTLLQYGNDAQKQEHLPNIVQGKIRWCQGYSEPGAGSDLAGLQCRAVEDGDEYVINGSKIWTSNADEADWIFCLVRTDPDAKKQEGITFLLIDMEQPGVTVRPIPLISGSSPFCETFFDDARADQKNVIYKKNAGWTVAKALLGHERTMIADAFGVGGGGSRLSLADRARKYLPGSADGRVSDAALRSEIAQMEIDSKAFGLTVQRSKDAAKAGHQPGPESSMFKVYGTELNMARHELMVRIAGPQALGWEGEGFEDDELALTRDWLRTRANSIEGGTSEVQRNIIAKRVLGLPD
jgi:alkylation response protein AidB-like acyl-CoA dehydrogenase